MDIGSVSLTGVGHADRGMTLHLAGGLEWQEQVQCLIKALETLAPLLPPRPTPTPSGEDGES